MKKFFLISSMFFLSIFIVKSQIVGLHEAKIIADKVLVERSSFNGRAVAIESLQASEVIVEKVLETALYYIINYENIGFVIISADKKMYPVLGYSMDGKKFDSQNMNGNLKYWMDGYKSDILYRKQKGIDADKNTKEAWLYYQNLNLSEVNGKSTKGVLPLIRSHWDQDSPYNDLCPADPAGPGGHVYVGCVATAMSQIMYYYRYPETGSGAHTYTPDGYPTQTANFGTANYKWEEMPNSPGTVNNEIAKLCWHAGVSVDMMYGNDGSGAYSADVPYALETYFLYNTDNIAYRSSYSTTNWRNKLITNLDGLMPVYYSGSDPEAGGHAFVCDGYQLGTTDSMYHFNWGWSGSGDGYFYLSEMNSGNGSFTLYQAGIFNIYPSMNYPTSCAEKVLTNSFGIIEDGSGYTSDYENNLDCSWTIATYSESGISGIRISFEEFATESSNDILTVYDGPDATFPVIGQFSGQTLPSDLNSTNDTIYLTFHTDASGTSTGWTAEYEALPVIHCTGITTLTTASGTVSDGSMDFNYSNEALCKWKIMPTGATTVTLHFNEFDTESTNDFVKIYDKYSGGTLLGTYSGNTLPPDLTSTKGSMYVMFSTNESVTGQGWGFSYTSDGTNTGIAEQVEPERFEIFPNPLHEGRLFIKYRTICSEIVCISINDISGKVIYQNTVPVTASQYCEAIDISRLSKGIYFVSATCDNSRIVKKLVKK